MVKPKRLMLLIVLLSFSLNFLFAQTPDVFRVEYMLMPNNSAESETSRMKYVLNMPISLRAKKDYIILGAEYNQFKFKVPENLFPNTNEIGKFHVVDINFGYMYKLSEQWRVIGLITPRWSSNFIQKQQRDDFNINYTIGAYKNVKDVEKPFMLVVGLSYIANAQIRIPLPFVYYEKRFHPKWSYVLGAPKTGMKYYTKKGHFFQTELFLDGYYVNIQNNILLPDNNLATDVSATALLLTLGYQYKITKDMSLYVIGGHSVFQNGVLRDTNRNDIFTVNDALGFYFRTGFRIGI